MRGLLRTLRRDLADHSTALDALDCRNQARGKRLQALQDHVRGARALRGVRQGMPRASRAGHSFSPGGQRRLAASEPLTSRPLHVQAAGASW